MSFAPSTASTASAASSTAALSRSTGLRPWLLLSLVGLCILVLPLSIGLANRAIVGSLPPVGYLPSLQVRRPHQPFRQLGISNLRAVQPTWVFIGDSMLGTRIDPSHLKRIAGTGDESVSFIYHAATGPAWWYLAFKNDLVASGVRPRMTFIFFRDTNLTDTMFRLDGHYGSALDEVAREWEPELDQLVAAHRKGTWFRVHRAVERVYQADIATSWMEPLIRRWWVRWSNPSADAEARFEWNLEQLFSVDFIRYDVGADLAQSEVADEPDFHRDLPFSVLPLIVELSREHGLPVCFVRVQRRPVNNRPPDQSPALQRYVADLRTWVEANGAMFHDDTGDPEMTLDLYEDGDHVADRRRYTEIFRKRLDPLFRPLDKAPDGTP